MNINVTISDDAILCQLKEALDTYCEIFRTAARDVTLLTNHSVRTFATRQSNKSRTAAEVSLREIYGGIPSRKDEHLCALTRAKMERAESSKLSSVCGETEPCLSVCGSPALPFGVAFNTGVGRSGCGKLGTVAVG